MANGATVEARLSLPSPFLSISKMSMVLERSSGTKRNLPSEARQMYLGQVPPLLIVWGAIQLKALWIKMISIFHFTYFFNIMFLDENCLKIILPNESYPWICLRKGLSSMTENTRIAPSPLLLTYSVLPSGASSIPDPYCRVPAVASSTS